MTPLEFLPIGYALSVAIETAKAKHGIRIFNLSINVVQEVDADKYDLLFIPGGSPDGAPSTVRKIKKALEITKSFFAKNKPVAAICHGPWLLVEADVVEGRTVTSWPSLRTDLENAGAEVIDREVVVDGNLITSRKPQDIPAIVAAFKKAVSEAASIAA